MRIWTLHPMYLDRQGLLALWREGLLAQAVLLGRTKGYVHHPQLTRFRAQRSPVASMATYLGAVHSESQQRGYHFDAARMQECRTQKQIPETQGQLQYEWSHLLLKVQKRSPEHFDQLRRIEEPEPHPLFEIVPGEIREWEKASQNQVLRTR